MSNYKVLWFDDEHETLEMIKEEALLNDIELIGFKNASDGIKELKENYKKYDSVLLDGLFFKTSEHTGDNVSGEAFGEVAKVLGNLKTQGTIIPWFIYSGQKSFVKEKNELVNVLADKAYANGKIFDKNKDEDFIELCKEIKLATDQQPYTRARIEFQESFYPFKLGIIDKKYEYLLLEIFASHFEEDYRKKNINVQRDLLEAIWQSLNFNIPCIPESFFDVRIKNKPNHEWCALFFENRVVRNNIGEYKIENFVPKVIGSGFRCLKESVNDLSHLGDEEVVKTPFITNMYLLITILNWLPGYIKSNYPNYI